jgi:membrane protein
VTTRDDTNRNAAIPGVEAERPTQIPKRGWLQIVKRAWKEAKTDNISLVAAGVAYYAFLALFPTLIAAVLLYGLIASPQDVQQQVDKIGTALPAEAQSLLSEQMSTIAATNSGALGIGLVIALLGALWSASGGVNGLITAINIAYDETETRGFIKMRGLSIALTIGAILFFIVAVVLIAVVPAVADAIAAVLVALALLYRIAPDRDAPQFKWVSIGSIVATAIWIVASLAFSLYVDNFGNYAKTYGSLAGVVILLLWLYVTSFIVLFGAEINAEAEQQTVKDTTRGEPKPLGERGAVKADSTPEEDRAAERRR